MLRPLIGCSCNELGGDIMRFRPFHLRQVVRQIFPGGLGGKAARRAGASFTCSSQLQVFAHISICFKPEFRKPSRSVDQYLVRKTLADLGREV